MHVKGKPQYAEGAASQLLPAPPPPPLFSAAAGPTIDATAGDARQDEVLALLAVVGVAA
jgi:hypothetical protein